MKLTNAVLLIALAALSTACLRKETTHRLSLQSDGSLTWTVYEERIRSDADDPRERAAEEREYLDLARTSMHPVALALDSLSPQSLETRVVRDASPFDVITTARLGYADDVFRRILRRSGGSGTVTLAEEEAGRTSLTLVVDLTAEQNDPQEGDPLIALVEDVDGYELTIAGARFVEARGFEILEQGTLARPLEDEPPPDQETLVLSLVWETE